MAIDPEVAREIACTREYFELAHGNLKDAVDERDKARADTLSRLNEQVVRMISRAESESARAVITDRAEQTRVSLEARIEELSRPNWTLIFSAISICLVLITGVWVLIGLKVDASVAPVAMETSQIKVQTATNISRIGQLEATSASSTQSDIQSRSDRSQLNERVHTLEGTVSGNAGERRSQYAVMAAKLIEIETQFCGSDNVRNLIHSNDTRIAAMLWAKAYPGEKMPTDNSFYPRICNRTPGDAGQGLQ